MRDVLGDAKKLAVVARHELLERRYVAVLSRMHKLQIITGWRVSELGAACSHIGIVGPAFYVHVPSRRMYNLTQPHLFPEEPDYAATTTIPSIWLTQGSTYPAFFCSAVSPSSTSIRTVPLKIRVAHVPHTPWRQPYGIGT